MEPTHTYTKDGIEYTLTIDGTVLQEYNPSTGVTTKFFTDSREVYYPHLKMKDHFSLRGSEYFMDYSEFFDSALLGLKVWYNRDAFPSSFALGEIRPSGSEYVMHYSQRKPILDMFRASVLGFISEWRSGKALTIALLTDRISPQEVTTQKSFQDRLAAHLPILN